MNERRAGRYTEFTARHDVATRVEEVLELFELDHSSNDGVGVTPEIRIVMPDEFEVSHDLAWVAWIEVEDIGLQPVHLIRRLMCRGMSDGHGAVELLTFAIDNRQYVRAAGATVEVADIWFHSKRLRFDRSGRLEQQSEAGVMIPSELANGQKMILNGDQIQDRGAFVTPDDIVCIHALVDQIEQTGKEMKKIRVGKSGLYLVETDEPERV